MILSTRFLIQSPSDASPIMYTLSIKLIEFVVEPSAKFKILIRPINALIGTADVSTVPSGARIASRVGLRQTRGTYC